MRGSLSSEDDVSMRATTKKLGLGVIIREIGNLDRHRVIKFRRAPPTCQHADRVPAWRWGDMQTYTKVGLFDIDTPRKSRGIETNADIAAAGIAATYLNL